VAPLAYQRGHGLGDGIDNYNFGQGRDDRVGQFWDPAPNHRFGKGGILSKFFEVSWRHVVRPVLASDLHRHIFAQFGIVYRADEIVERREPDFQVCSPHIVVEQRKILAMCIVVVDEAVKNDRVKQASEISDRGVRDFAQKGKAVLEGRPSLLLVLRCSGRGETTGILQFRIDIFPSGTRR
jgi:hypothetical protein